jgi:hypothetical protein
MDANHTLYLQAPDLSEGTPCEAPERPHILFAHPRRRVVAERKLDGYNMSVDASRYNFFLAISERTGLLDRVRPNGQVLFHAAT